MAPKAPNPPKTKGQGKGKAPKDNQQSSQIEFGLPASTVVSLQSISSRATQDLWASTAFQSEGLTAEQLAQRRTNATSRLTKRIVGNVQAKEDLAKALTSWFVQVSQHLLGLMGRVRAIGSKLDEDLAAAIQEMQGFLASQPSAVTSDQIAHAHNRMGPIWTALQEQEVVRMAAMLRAFGQVASPSTAGLPGDMVTAVPSENLPSAIVSEPGSDFSFGGDFPVGAVATTAELSGPPIAAPITGPRWKRRSSTTTGRPSKSPRRETSLEASPWIQPATGLTPEARQRQPQTVLHEDTSVVEPHNQAPIPALPPWFSCWLRLISFAVENGNERVGDLARDPVQAASFPAPLEDCEADVAVACAQQVWEAMRVMADKKDAAQAHPLCQALHQVLARIRGAPSVLPSVPQGVLLAAHITQGALLDPYSYAPATLQEWLFPSALLEQGIPLKGYIALQASTAPEVQGLLLHPCPFYDAEPPSAAGPEEELIPDHPA